MAYVPPEYPGAIPEFAEVWPVADDVNWMYTAAWDAMVKELRAVQIELGTDPAGTFATVKARLDALLPHFHDRGDPAVWDMITGNFTTDGTWRNIDFSGLVPAGAKALLIKTYIWDDAVGSTLDLRKDGNTNTENTGNAKTQVANVAIQADMVIPCSTGRIIEYNATNTVWSGMYLLVKGWWK